MEKYKKIVCILLMVFFVTLMSTSCKKYEAEGNVSNTAINSGIPVYDSNETLYYVDYEALYSGGNGVLKEKDKDGNTKTIKGCTYGETITAVFALDNWVYYSVTVLFGNHISIHKYDKNTGDDFIIIEDEFKSLPQYNDYIYTEDNSTVYYFSPKEGLWIYKDNQFNKYIKDSYSCLVLNNIIYYSDKDGMKSYDLAEEKYQNLCSVSEIQNLFENDLFIQRITSVSITNLTYCDNSIYFLLTDYLGGRIFSIDLNGKNLRMVTDNISANRFVIDNNKLYFYGTEQGEAGKNLFSYDSEKHIKKISSDGVNGFYPIGEKVYYYNESMQLITSDMNMNE